MRSRLSDAETFTSAPGSTRTSSCQGRKPLARTEIPVEPGVDSEAARGPAPDDPVGDDLHAVGLDLHRHRSGVRAGLGGARAGGAGARVQAKQRSAATSDVDIHAPSRNGSLPDRSRTSGALGFSCPALPAVERRAHPGHQRRGREGLREELHARIQDPTVGDGILGVARDEEREQTRTVRDEARPTTSRPLIPGMTTSVTTRSMRRPCCAREGERLLAAPRPRARGSPLLRRTRTVTARTAASSSTTSTVSSRRDGRAAAGRAARGACAFRRPRASRS